MEKPENNQGGCNGEQRFMLLLRALAIMSIFGLVLLLVVWPEKEVVALTLFVLFALFVSVYLQGKRNEQNIRLTRERPAERKFRQVPH